MKIMLVITGLSLGGAEKQVLDLADRLHEKGHNVLIVYLKDNIEIYPDNKINMITLDMTMNPYSIIRSFVKLNTIFREFSPDVVHSHMYHANIITRFLRIFSKIPKLISTIHTNNEDSSLRYLMYKLTNNYPDLISAVSNDTLECFKKNTKYKGESLVIYNGINTDKFHYNIEYRNKHRGVLNLSDEDILLFCAGRLTEAKDYPNLLSSFSILTSKRENIYLAIAGVGPLHQNLLQLVNHFGLDKKVFFLGARDDVHELMSAADLFVLASKWEGFGLVVAEAMASECLVIATNSGGVSEIVSDKNCLVPTCDATLLSNKIEQYLSLPKYIVKDIKSEAKKKVLDAYSMNAITEIWLQSYENYSR